MKYLSYSFLLILILSLPHKACKSHNNSIKSVDGEVITVNDIKENTIVLIYSYTCGYSLSNTERFNKFKNEIESNESISLIALSENAKDSIFEIFPDYKQILKEDLAWKTVENAREFYLPFLKNEVYPQFLLFKKGKLKYKIEGVPYEEEYEKLKKLASVN